MLIKLDHIDGNSLNNKLENLRFLCPNCHTQTPTYGSKNIKKNNKQNKNFKLKLEKVEKQRPTKIQWPNKEELKILIWSAPLIIISNKLGVSDTAIKKHCKKYQISLPPQGYWNRIKAGHNHEESLESTKKVRTTRKFFTIEQLKEIRELIELQIPIKEIAKKFNVFRTVIGDIKNGTTYRNVI